MTRRACIYVITHNQHTEPHVAYAIEKLRNIVDILIVVTSTSTLDETDAALNQFLIDQVVSFHTNQPVTFLNGYVRGLEKLKEMREKGCAVLLTGSHAFLPIAEIKDNVFGAKDEHAQVYSSYWHNAKLDHRLVDYAKYGRLLSLDFLSFSSAVTQDEAFWSFWEGLDLSNNYWQDFVSCSGGLAVYTDKAGISCVFPLDESILATMDPGKFEIHKLVEYDVPAIPVSAFTLDPILHDLNAIYLRDAIDLLRHKNPVLYKGVMHLIARRLPLREFNSIADQYEIIPEVANNPKKSEWNIGRIAIFIHVYYSDMMPLFWERLQSIPCEFDLFITTSTEENKRIITEFLQDHSFQMSRSDIRIVHMNRGRDMSSLFITFRDVILSDKYEIALRMHSKRTPQVSGQVGDSFKDHLFENLVHSPEYMRNVLDLLEEQPDIGLLIPPIIHIGFGTLGHSWFNNKSSLKSLAVDMGITVPLDISTPVAPYGTMFWFRTNALRRMFKWKWKWEDYNEEPHHIDGGLAHIQERLIGYCAQDSGYRVVSIMNPRLAARYYAKLEYKMQLISSYMMHNSIYHQREQMIAIAGKKRNNLYRYLEKIYGKLLARMPGSRRYLRPIARTIQYVLRPEKLR